MRFEPQRRHYVTVFVISMALLMLEIAIARILSVALVSHFAFAAISLAMFGLGLSGLAVYLSPQRFAVDRFDAQLIRYAALFGVSAALAVPLFLRLNIVQTISAIGFLELSLVYILLAVPFFFGGICVSLALTHGSARIGRVYFADLAGASAGCLAVILAMELGSAPLVAVVVAALATVVSVVLALTVAPRQLLASATALLAVLIVLALGATTDLLRVVYIKGNVTHPPRVEHWNSFSRVTAFDSPNLNAAQILPLAAPPAERAGAHHPKTMVLDIDGGAWAPMTNFTGDFAPLHFFRQSILYAVHHLRPSTDVLIIGAGAGRDILGAKVFGQPSVLGLELNPLMRRIVQEDLGDYSGRPYTLPGVEVIVDEARSRLSSLPQGAFGIVQLSLIDTFTLNASGGLVFSENYLYTLEAFREYFRRLKDDGIFVVTRYYAPQYPVELMRLAGMARAAWEAEGVPRPADGIVILGQAMNFTVLAKRTPYTDDELAQVEKVAAMNGMEVLYRPGLEGPGYASVGTLLTTDDFTGFVDAYPFLIGPPTDDRPFFFHLLRGRLAAADIPDGAGDPFQFMRLWTDSISLMYLLVAVVTALAIVFFVGPLLLTTRQRAARPAAIVAAPLLLYFACLGYGFMMIEIPLLQTFILFLGYPVYALAVVLLSLLLSSGVGSLLSTRFADPGRALIRVLIAIMVLGALYLGFVPMVIKALLGLAVPLRIAVTAILLTPIGLLLGMAFPLGITVLRGYSEELVPWAWGLNGALSVVASVLAIFLGSRFGFSLAFLTGIAAYGVGLLLMVGLPRIAAYAHAPQRHEDTKKLVSTPA
jgi:SAM-dependent methyltransferase